jgi:hypothetical protein
VYNRISRGERIFADPNEAIEFTEIVRDIKKRDGWTVLEVPKAWHLTLAPYSAPFKRFKTNGTYQQGPLDSALTNRDSR